MKEKDKYISILIIFGLLMGYMSCSSKLQRKELERSHTRESFFDETKEQKTEDLELEISSQEVQEILEDQKRLGETFQKSMQAFWNFKESKNAFAETYQFLLDIGTEPGPAQQNELGHLGMSGTKSVEGLRYFMAKFDSPEDPTYFTFELEPFKKAYEVAHHLVKDHYPDLGEPCFESAFNSVAYQLDDYLLRVYEVSQDDILAGHPNKPRSAEDIGSVEVIIEYDVHGICGKTPEELEAGHDHSEHDH